MTMKFKIKVYCIWESGQRKDSEGKPHQEDCTFPLPDELKDSDRTFILCDGMGGHDAGEVASATVCQAMGNYILNDGHDAEGVFTEEDLNGAIAAAFDALDRKDNGAEKKMGTTMTFLKLHKEGATVAHMGDSRVYHIRPGKDGVETQILFESEDHSLVNDLIKVGELTREEARRSRQKNVITRAMQPNMDRRPKADVRHITDIKAGDYFYMCSDGMLEAPDMESGESLRNIFSEKVESAERKVEILRNVTEDNRDNHTALIIHIEEVFGNEAQPAYGSSSAVPSKRMGIVDDNETLEDSAAKSRTYVAVISGVIAAMVLAAVILVGINYFPSCSGEQSEKGIDIQSHEDTDESPIYKKDEKSEQRGQVEHGSQSQIKSSQFQEQVQETVNETANSDAIILNHIEDSRPNSDSSPAPTFENIPLPQSEDDAMDSDVQAIVDSLSNQSLGEDI